MITFIQFILSFYTCYLVLLIGKNDVDYTETLRKYFGKFGYYSGMVIFILNFCIPIIIFF